MKGYSQLNYRKRIRLETLFSLKLSKFDIAAKMNVCLKTVYNEWNKGRYLHTNSDLTTEWRYSIKRRALQIKMYQTEGLCQSFSKTGSLQKK